MIEYTRGKFSFKAGPVQLIGYIAALSSFVYLCFAAYTFATLGKSDTNSFEENTVAIVDIDGIITHHGISGISGAAAGKVFDAKKFAETMAKLSQDKNVSAVLLRLDSPGGMPTGAQEIINAINYYRDLNHKPVYAYVVGLCASACMYPLSAADDVFALNGTIIGNVGVRGASVYRYNGTVTSVGSFLGENVQAQEIKKDTYFAGIGKNAFDPFQETPQIFKDNYQRLIDNAYKDFIYTVLRGRVKKGVTEEFLRESGASVFGEADSKKVGFIDHIVSGEMVVRSMVTDLLRKRNGGIVSYSFKEVTIKKGIIQGLFSDFTERFVPPGYDTGKVRLFLKEQPILMIYGDF